MTEMLNFKDVELYYDHVYALKGVSITVNPVETVALIGANGAGKSSILRAITGLRKIKSGTIHYLGERLDGTAPADIVRKGIAMVPEGRRLFPSLTVEENLLIGAHARTGNGHWTLERVQALFPILKDRRLSPGTALSGGQQQMVAIGRALMSNPRVLLCDELSLGLAPVVIKEIYAAFPQIKASGTSIIVVEQDIGQALRVADHVHCMMEGRITLSGRPAELSREAIHDAYFGVSHA